METSNQFFNLSMIRMVDKFGTISTVINNSSGLNGPAYLAFNSTGDLFVTEPSSNKIKKITFTWLVSLVNKDLIISFLFILVE